MKMILRGLILAGAMIAQAQAATTVQLETPHLVDLNPIVSLSQPACYAAQATTTAYKTVVTGFSSDQNYVQGQVLSRFSCGRSGRGGAIYTVSLCTYLTWDLSGNLVNVNTPSNGVKSSACPVVPVALPPTTPPSESVVGNEFINVGGSIAETIIVEACGSIACYATYYYPEIIT